jgi:heme oxygenase
MSNNLKELTKAHHDNAERTEFADLLLGGSISPRLYQMYLRAQLQNYLALESAVAVPMELEAIFRSAQIEQDLQEIESLFNLDELHDTLQ